MVSFIVGVFLGSVIGAFAMILVSVGSKDLEE